jgi:hypothetical protein
MHLQAELQDQATTSQIARRQSTADRPPAASATTTTAAADHSSTTLHPSRRLTCLVISVQRQAAVQTTGIANVRQVAPYKAFKIDPFGT